MTAHQILHFSLGPVQGFVAQARRTRDLWAGSFLLSWLTANAIAAVIEAGGRVCFPVVDDDPLVKAVLAKRAGRTPGDTPEIGTVPNRFKAEVGEQFDPQACVDAINLAWTRLCNAVWKDFVADVAPSGRREPSDGAESLTRRIWSRQVAGFWEFQWVMGPPDGTDSAWLDQRKNWRSHLPPTEAGDHCTLMGSFQELSGFERHSRAGRQRQDEFWADMQRRAGNLNLRTGERLCALALIKRLFPCLGHELVEVMGWIPGGGVERLDSWPSTGHIAASTWISHATTAAPIACDRYASFVRRALSPLHFGERQSRISSLRGLGAFAELDANLLHPEDVRNERALPLFDKEDADANHLRPELARELAALLRDPKVKDLRGPGTYYAVLLMDGDRVGELITTAETAVSAALNRFAAIVSPTVEKHSGVTIYCGGDDVLAMLPLEAAIQAAIELRESYRRAFEGALGLGESATISGALVLADHHEPLRSVLDEARRALDEVAKNGNGRDSLAVVVWKPSGPAVEWVSKWDSPGEDLQPALRLVQLASDKKALDRFSNRFVYRVRERYLQPFGNTLGNLDLTPEELRTILSAELARRREAPPDSEELLSEPIDDVLTICRPRASAADGAVGADFDPSGLLLVRFLAQKGLWS